MEVKTARGRNKGTYEQGIHSRLDNSFAIAQCV